MENTKSIILIAGGSGLIGKKLQKTLIANGAEVRVLSRNPKGMNDYKWSPIDNFIDPKALNDVDTIINLAGSGIADKRWSEAYKKDLYESRILPTRFLLTLVDQLPKLKQYISASGINCYGYDFPGKIHVETDSFGKDFLSNLVRLWEEEADTFEPHCLVSKIRISVVLSKDGGALPKISGPVKLGIGSPLGSGKQWMPWIHESDLCNLISHVHEKRLKGTYNAISSASTNTDFTKTVAKVLKKPLFMPKVPAFALKLLFGEMASVVLQGVNASNKKIKDSGFEFKYDSLEKSIFELKNK